MYEVIIALDATRFNQRFTIEPDPARKGLTLLPASATLPA